MSIVRVQGPLTRALMDTVAQNSQDHIDLWDEANTALTNLQAALAAHGAQIRDLTAATKVTTVQGGGGGSGSGGGSSSLPLPVPPRYGGTGDKVLPPNAVLIGEGPNPVNGAVPQAAGYVLTDNGPANDPSFQPLPATYFSESTPAPDPGQRNATPQSAPAPNGLGIDVSFELPNSWRCCAEQSANYTPGQGDMGKILPLSSATAQTVTLPTGGSPLKPAAFALPIRIVQSASGTVSSSQTSITVPYTSANVAGNLLIAVWGQTGNNAPAPTFSSAQGETWVPLGSTSTTYGSSALAWAIAKGGPNSVTVTVPLTGNPDMIVAEYAGLAPSPVDSVLPFVTAGNSPLATGTLTTTDASDLVISYGFQDYENSGTWGASAGWSTIASQSGSQANGGQIVAYQQANVAAGAYSNSISNNGSLRTLHGGIVSFGTPPGTPPAQDLDWQIWIQNNGAGTWSIAGGGVNIDGSANPISLAQGQGMLIRVSEDGSGWQSFRGYGSGSGNVTGPASSVAGDFAQFADATGKVIEDAGLSLTTDGTLAADSDLLIPSEKATKTYVDGLLATNLEINGVSASGGAGMELEINGV